MDSTVSRSVSRSSWPGRTFLADYDNDNDNDYDNDNDRDCDNDCDCDNVNHRLRFLFCHLFKDHRLCMIIMLAFLPAITGKMHPFATRVGRQITSYMNAGTEAGATQPLFSLTGCGRQRSLPQHLCPPGKSGLYRVQHRKHWMRPTQGIASASRLRISFDCEMTPGKRCESRKFGSS